jgi:class 3 adenylate cyclase/tetratricopeptide (TPR) repeat protein
MLCARCGTDNSSANRFCGDCGGPLANRCGQCGVENPPGKKFCGDCGSALGKEVGTEGKLAAAGPPQVKSTTPRILIALDASSVTEGERKTVTALFADIKGSTELMEDLDPEEARAIIDPALKLMIDAVHRYDGYVVQSTGDGIFALFGAPMAHEDHPQRALYAALRVQEELNRYSVKVVADGSSPIQGRIGINTGEVVVRSIQTGASQFEYTPIGHSTNLASRMQTAAPIGSIAISEATRKLCEGYFTLKPLGATRVKGVSEPVNMYEVTGMGPLRTRLQRAVGRGLTKFVGRGREMEVLKHAAEQAILGHGQIVAVMAEPGVGKSRLFFEFKTTSQSNWMALETFSISHGKASAYLPVIDLLRNYFDISATDDERKRREKVTGRVLALNRSLEDTLPYLLALLGIVEGGFDPLSQMDGPVKRRRTLEAIKRIILRESLNQPLMVIFEDLHWIDEATQEFLNLLADSIGTAQIMLLVNYRPEYSHQWGSKTYYTQLRLDPLSGANAEEMLTTLLGVEAQFEPLRRLIAERTEGNPFFMEEIVQALFEQDVLVRDGEVKIVRSIAEIKVPPTVQAVLASRIDRLPAGEKELLQTLAVIGREFKLPLIQRLANRSEAELERMLTRLQGGEFIYEQPVFPDTEYIFKHALTQEVAYNSVLLERRKMLHERIGAAVEAINSGRLEDELEELVHHYSRSDNAEKAFAYMRLAADQAVRRSHYDEARNYTQSALELLNQVHESPERLRAELALQLILFRVGAMTDMSSASDSENALNRAYEIAQQIPDQSETFPVLASLWTLCFLRGDLRKSEKLAMQLIEISDKDRDDRHYIEANFVLGDTLYWEGRFREALSNLNFVVANYRPAMGILNTHGWDSLSLGLAYGGLVRWQLGQPGSAFPMISKAIERANAIGSPETLLIIRYVGCHLHWLQRDWARLEAEAELIIRLSDELGFSAVSDLAKAYGHCASVQQRPTPSSLVELSKIARQFQILGFGLNVPTWLIALAEGYSALGDIEAGLATLTDAFALIQETSEHEREAELFRVRGELLQKGDRPNLAKAEASFHQAIEIARGQEAKSYELRTTISLARLLASQDRREEARAMLAEINGWFTEGFDTLDLKDATQLLAQLAG